jgi:hypothetical protein
VEAAPRPSPHPNRNVVQGTSRALSEEVAFGRARVTSTDWLSYPILDITEAPAAIDIVLLNRPELPPAGAGESSIRPFAAALANAVFDATGVRLRRAPLTPGAAEAGVGIKSMQTSTKAEHRKARNSSLRPRCIREPRWRSSLKRIAVEAHQS